MKETISLGTSRKMKNMGLLCAVLVVVIHVPWPHDTPFSIGWFLYEGLAEGVARMAVPYFFAVSGFFLARHFDEKGWWPREIGKRLRSLVPPYVVWSLVALLASIFLSIVFDMAARKPFGTSLHFPEWREWGEIFGLDFSEYPLNIPLWYVRCLLVLVDLSFVLDRIVSKLGYAWVAASFLFLLFCRRIPAGDWSTYLYHASLGLVCFSAGIALRKFPLPACPPAVAVLSGLIGLALLGLKMAASARGWPFGFELGVLDFPFLLIAAWQWVPESKWPDILTSCAFPIFLMNIVVIRVVEPFLLHAGLARLPAAFAELAAGVVCPCVVAWLVRRHVPSAVPILYGGR